MCATHRRTPALTAAKHSAHWSAATLVRIPTRGAHGTGGAASARLHGTFSALYNFGKPVRISRRRSTEEEKSQATSSQNTEHLARGDERQATPRRLTRLRERCPKARPRWIYH